MTDLLPLELKVPKNVTYILPEIKDDDGDTYTVTFTFGTAAKCSYWLNKQLTVIAFSSCIGSHKILIHLTDKNK